MKDKLVIRLLLAVAFIVAAVCAVYFGGKMEKLRADNKRLAANQESMLFSLDTLTLANGAHLAHVQQLELTKGELEKAVKDKDKELAAMDIKVNRLQMMLNTASTTKVNVEAQLIDSIVKVPSKFDGDITFTLDTLKAWHWQDAWVSANGTINKRGWVHADFTSHDSLMIVGHRVPKRFLCFKFGCKRIELDIKSSNPHTKLTYARMLQLVK